MPKCFAEHQMTIRYDFQPSLVSINLIKNGRLIRMSLVRVQLPKQKYLEDISQHTE